MADIFAEVASVGIQGLSAGGTVYVVPGATGSTGPQGDIGATGPAGAAGASGIGGGSGGIVAWDSGATYNQYDLVSFQGNLYYWIGPATGNSSNDPSNDPSKWQLSTGAGGGNGATGPAGATGLTGATGIAGASGVGTGSHGATGVQGEQGASGATGTQGAQGASGIGFTGASGAQGTNGASGATGVQGASGVAGATGAGLTGATGINGASGATGTGFVIQGAWVLNSAYNVNDIVTYNNNTYVCISPVPPNNPSATPDNPSFFLPLIVSGATGAGLTGATGATGPQGLQGASGINGASGYVGRDGASGIPGSTGAQGLTGATGIQGNDGATGVGIIQTLTFTTSSTDEVIIDIIDITTVRSIKYEMQETSGSSYNASELRLLNSNENVFLTQYAGIGSPLGSFNTYFSPVNNNYSSPDINAGLSYWNGTTLRIYTNNSIVQQALLSAIGSTPISLNLGAYNITLATAFHEVSSGIYQATTVESHSPLQLVSNISWAGTGFCELRYTPNNAITTLKYQKTEIEV